jgi:hypothetical protein
MYQKTSNNQQKLMNIQMDCHFGGKSSTSDHDKVKEKNIFWGQSYSQQMRIKTSNLADYLLHVYTVGNYGIEKNW